MTPEQRSAKATEAATLLRQAAGVYQHLAEVVAGSIQEQLPGDRWVPAREGAGLAGGMASPFESHRHCCIAQLRCGASAGGPLLRPSAGRCLTMAGPATQAGRAVQRHVQLPAAHLGC